MNPSRYANLAAHCGASTIDLLTAALVEELQRIQPVGPYTLAGFSLGGRIVLQMAARDGPAPPPCYPASRAGGSMTLSLDEPDSSGGE